MSDRTRTREALVARIIEGDGRTSRAMRRAAFNSEGLEGALRTLIEKVAKCAYTVTDDDMAAVKASGLDEDQIFELVVCAAVGQASRQPAAALTALDQAMRSGGR